MFLFLFLYISYVTVGIMFVARLFYFFVSFIFCCLVFYIVLGAWHFCKKNSKFAISPKVLAPCFWRSIFYFFVTSPFTFCHRVCSSFFFWKKIKFATLLFSFSIVLEARLKKVCHFTVYFLASCLQLIFLYFFKFPMLLFTSWHCDCFVL